MRFPFTLSLAFASVGLAACATSDEESATVAAVSCPDLNNQSVIETNPAIVTEARFAMKRVFDRIRLTTPAGIGVPASPTAMFQEVYAAFANCTSGNGIDPNHYGLSCRSNEATVAQLDPFTGIAGKLHYKPVALVDRFDLAPANFSTCGESRLVFWKDAGINGRAAIIIELRTPPVVQSGVKSCRPIANFWASLSNISDPNQRAQMLDDFYFKGLTGMPFPPVSAQGAGFSGAGQVRLNSFVNFAQWNLREFKFQKVCVGTVCNAHFVAQTVKNNPSQLLFAGTHAKSPAFQSWFVGTAVPALAKATDVNALGLGNANGFNTFESVSQPGFGDPTSVDYAAAASATLRTNVQTELTTLGSTLLPDDIFHRATTQTCGGCHQISNNANLGGGLTWPSSGGFVQIDENGIQAPALSGTFIPHRKIVLENFLCSGPPAADATVTIDGRPVDAPN